MVRDGYIPKATEAIGVKPGQDCVRPNPGRLTDDRWHFALLFNIELLY